MTPGRMMRIMAGMRARTPWLGRRTRRCLPGERVGRDVREDRRERDAASDQPAVHRGELAQGAVACVSSMEAHVGSVVKVLCVEPGCELGNHYDRENDGGAQCSGCGKRPAAKS